MNQKNKKLLEGIVISNKMQKTIVVKMERLVRHPKYEKQVKRSTKLHVHDENMICKIGDRVLIEQCRPISKLKTWKLNKLIDR